jgi:hypothetical protein
MRKPPAAPINYFTLLHDHRARLLDIFQRSMSQLTGAEQGWLESAAVLNKIQEMWDLV